MNRHHTRTRFGLEADLWPDATVVEMRRLRTGDSWSAVLLVTGYPATLPWGWAGRLAVPGTRVAISLHLEGVPAQVAAMQLQRRRARLESQRRYQSVRGRLEDPAVEAAAADAADLAAQVARGHAQLHRQALYLTVHAEDPADLDLVCARVRSRAAAAMIDLRPATARQLPGAIAGVPFGIDPVGAHRTVDTATAAAAFPFASPDLGAIPETAVLYGTNLYTGAPVLWDRWASQENHNSVTIARSGAGKSYLTKTTILRELYQGVRVVVVDPESEYLALAAHVGGTVHRPGGPGERLDPLAMPAVGEADELSRRRLFAGTVVETLLGERLPGVEAAVLQRAVAACYEAAGISDDPATWARPAPALADVTAVLASDTTGADLAARLGPWVGPGTVFDMGSASTPSGVLSSASPLEVWDLAAVPAELAPVATLLVLDQIWRSLTPGGPRTLIVVDEAWLMLRTGQGAQWLSRLAKSARKRNCGLSVVTQDAEDVTGTELGRTVIHNAATQVLLRQAPQAIDGIAAAFKLTTAAAALIGSARLGEGLLLGGGAQIAFRALASPVEHRLALTGLSAGSRS
ncbi:VirB4 family type IV secretion system protein [Glycomyces sp. MUSA5-2]|uniref:VirB4 family type IV secretion system protein n=1 Tax=Glycomyces sp. MUSA5-2 TaxID=2053002 RepID=UPI003008A41D